MSHPGNDQGLEWLIDQLQQILDCNNLYAIDTLLIHEEKYVREKIGDSRHILEWLDAYINFELKRRIEERESR